jgi:hypothetical protein
MLEMAEVRTLGTCALGGERNKVCVVGIDVVTLRRSDKEAPSRRSRVHVPKDSAPAQSLQVHVHVHCMYL